MYESKSGSYRIEVTEVDEEIILEVLEEQEAEGYEHVNAFVDGEDLFLIFKSMKKKYDIVCEQCGKKFTSDRESTKTCSGTCRQAKFRGKGGKK